MDFWKLNGMEWNDHKVSLGVHKEMEWNGIE